ncbi:hypothetical protein PGTUg99_021686 [Puccinia graminis f. sp. tritici]|uniref:Uncharacterized protein n=1 Tax=Puccinia graminis f. sp. tritici TaxID=56615 RepID=A0A5B0SFN3_PUCGR|nr:hypothetical protein PGTUg99_021686 [Puccinia graminis f. sp. tritici]
MIPRRMLLSHLTTSPICWYLMLEFTTLPVSPTLERWPILPDELESYSVENFLGLSYNVAPSLSPAELEQEWELSQSTRQEFSLQTVTATPLQLHSENPHTAAKKLKYNDELQLSGSRSIPSSQLFQFNAQRHLNSGTFQLFAFDLHDASTLSRFFFYGKLPRDKFLRKMIDINKSGSLL